MPPRGRHRSCLRRCRDAFWALAAGCFFHDIMKQNILIMKKIVAGDMPLSPSRAPMTEKSSANHEFAARLRIRINSGRKAWIFPCQHGKAVHMPVLEVPPPTYEAFLAADFRTQLSQGPELGNQHKTIIKHKGSLPLELMPVMDARKRIHVLFFFRSPAMPGPVSFFQVLVLFVRTKTTSDGKILAGLDPGGRRLPRTAKSWPGT